MCGISRHFSVWTDNTQDNQYFVRDSNLASQQYNSEKGRAIGQAMWDLWWIKRHWSRVSPSTSVSPANSHSTDCSILIINHPGLVQ
jgi:hypothetical protein